jgi:hypothetical protein
MMATLLVWMQYVKNHYTIAWYWNTSSSEFSCILYKVWYFPTCIYINNNIKNSPLCEMRMQCTLYSFKHRLKENNIIFFPYSKIKSREVITNKQPKWNKIWKWKVNALIEWSIYLESRIFNSFETKATTYYLTQGFLMDGRRTGHLVGSTYNFLLLSFLPWSSSRLLILN